MKPDRNNCPFLEILWGGENGLIYWIEILMNKKSFKLKTGILRQLTPLTQSIIPIYFSYIQLLIPHAYPAFYHLLHKQDNTILLS